MDFGELFLFIHTQLEISLSTYSTTEDGAFRICSHPEHLQTFITPVIVIPCMDANVFIQSGATAEHLCTMLAFVGFNFFMRVTVSCKTAFILEFSSALVTGIIHRVTMH